MKIICDNCRTKYSIADEKVKGKVFKIRCKKCSNIIVVRGNQPREEAAPASEEGGGDYAPEGGDYKDAPVWHLVVDQKQIGPMTEAEVRDRFAQGEIDVDTFTWREGFTDWLRLVDVEDFADMAQATTVAPASMGEPAAEPAMNLGGGGGFAEQPADPQWNADAQAGAAAADAGWGGEQAAAESEPAAWNAPAAEPAPEAWNAQDGDNQAAADALGAAPAEEPAQDLFASQSVQEPAAPSPAADPGGNGGLFGAAAAPAEGGGDLFATGGGGGGGEAGQQMFPPEEEPEPEAQSQLTGARNENSVLFSLSNLQDLAMGGGKPSGGEVAPSPAAAPPEPGAAGLPAQSDGSGLIDIRAMASAASPAPAGSAGGDDHPSLGGFSAPIAAAPILIPAASEERPKWVMPAILGGGGFLVLAIVGLVLVLFLRKPDPVHVAMNTTKADPTKPGEAATPKEKTESKTAGGATENAGTGAEKKDEAATDKSSPEPKAKSGSGRRPKRRGKRRDRKTSPDPAPSRPAPAARPRKKRSGKRDALDDLIDGAVGKKKPSRTRRAPAASSSNSNLPSKLTRQQIQAGMRGIKGKVQGCYDRYKVPGLANVRVTITKNGRIKSARVKGMFSGTPTGACVQAASRSAKFDRFNGQSMTITYPFILR